MKIADSPSFLHMTVPLDLFSSKASRTSERQPSIRQALKDVLALSPQAIKNMSDLEQAETALLEAKSRAHRSLKSEASERIGSIKERLKVLKLFSKLGDKRIALEAARLAREITGAVRLYASVSEDSETEGASKEQDGTSADLSAKESSIKEAVAFAADAKDTLKIARDIVEEYLRMHPEDKDGRSLRNQIQEAVHAISTLAAQNIAGSLEVLTARY